MTLAALNGLPVSAAELFKAESTNTLSANTLSANTLSANMATTSQFGVDQRRSTNASISDSYIYNLNAQALAEDTVELTVNLNSTV